MITTADIAQHVNRHISNPEGRFTRLQVYNTMVGTI